MANPLHIPATPEAKLLVRMDQARTFGKEFDEEKERRVMGLPPAAGRAPIFIAESDRRKQLVAREDIAGIRELEKEVAAQGQVAVAERMADTEAENARLRAQIAELTGQPAEEPSRPAPPKPKSPSAEKADTGVTLPDGEPTKDWTRAQMLEFAKREGLTMPPKNGFGMKNLAILDHIVGEAAKKLADTPSE